MDFQYSIEAFLISSVLEVIALLIAALTIYKTMKWNRKKATIDKLESYDYYVSYAFLERTVNFHTGEGPIDKDFIVMNIRDNPDILNHIFTVLQYHTSLVRGTRNGTYKKQIVDNNRSHAITRTYFMFSEFIDYRRRQLHLQTTMTQWRSLP